VRFVIDHLGVGYAPPLLGVFPPEPFEHLPEVLDFARFSNVSLKLTGAPALSAEPYPFRDVWPSVYEIVASYGVERVMWGSDFTRAAGLVSYWDTTHFLSEMDAFRPDDLEWLYGGSIRKFLRWSPGPHVRPRPSHDHHEPFTKQGDTR